MGDASDGSDALDGSGGSDGSDEPDTSDDGSWSRPECPSCGEPVTFVTASGPHTGTVSPCGCSVPPGLISRARGASEHGGPNE
ncbi:hypothetical protein [Natrinema pallidum]|uniref:Small CPxCG-related zinc finger protein n=1 Tax=Natrinema pallidum DSM 3751 TaxID=1227495 RepID=L9YSU5_9EURY|nr:hypothetical protein [Natrinema pallidum]ELY76761.1 hypothetical protein C487_10664 [Natrinema pallidum DSM 3751]